MVKRHPFLFAQKALLTRSRGYKALFMLNSAEHEVYPAHNCCKIPTIVGILTFISMINTTSERPKARHFICRYFSFYEQLKFHAQLS